MSQQPRAVQNHTPAFKAKVALAAIKGEKTLEQNPTGVNRLGFPDAAPM